MNCPIYLNSQFDRIFSSIAIIPNWSYQELLELVPSNRDKQGGQTAFLLSPFDHLFTSC